MHEWEAISFKVQYEIKTGNNRRVRGSHPGTKLYKLSDPMTSSTGRKGQSEERWEKLCHRGAVIATILRTTCCESQSRLHLYQYVSVHYILYLLATPRPNLQLLECVQACWI